MIRSSSLSKVQVAFFTPLMERYDAQWLGAVSVVVFIFPFFIGVSFRARLIALVTYLVPSVLIVSILSVQITFQAKRGEEKYFVVGQRVINVNA